MIDEAFFGKIGKIKLANRILIFVGIIVLLGGLFTWRVYIPRTEEIDRLSKDIAGLKQKIQQAKIRVKNLEKFKAEEVKVDAQLKEALLLLPRKKEIPTLLKTITDLGIESNLEFNLFSPQKEISKDFYFEIPVSIRVTGKYFDVAVFFDKVGRMKRIVNIFDVSMKPKEALSTVLNTTCTATTYRIKDQ